MEETNHRRRIRVAKVKFSVGQHVRISKQKMKFAKSGEQTFSTEIFRITKVIERRPRPVYELEDLNNTPIGGNFTRRNSHLFESKNRPLTR